MNTVMNSGYIGVATSAVLTFGLTSGSFSSYDTSPYTSNYDDIEQTRESMLYSSSKLNESVSGINTVNFIIKTPESYSAPIEDFIRNIRDSQLDIEQDLKSLISDNLWDLYD